MKKFYITTPIYYVNDKPHIGHAYTTIAADILARYYRLKLDKNSVFFLTGTDEHGAKIAEAAGKKNKTPKEFCDDLIPEFQKRWKELNITNDYFIRTTNKKHIKIVEEILTKIYKNGDIYKDTYSGYYCVGCEKYLTKTDMVNGRCPLHPNKKPIKQKEENYFFKLSKYQNKILRLLENKELEILPKERYNEIYSKVKAGLDDISLSREEVEWGIPIPWDKTQTVYVWFDALLNYYSATLISPVKNKKIFFPADVHLMAKDIVWFHGVIWPAMCLSAGLTLPKKIFAHGYFTIDGVKMSKSLGNMIDSQDLVKKFGADAVRYYLMTAFPFGPDGDVSVTDLKNKYNNELANSLGNLISRVSHLCEKYQISVCNQEIKEKFLKIDVGKIGKLTEEFQFDQALKEIFVAINNANKFIENEKPWELAKDDQNRLNYVLTELIKVIQEIGFVLLPYLPNTAQIILKAFEKKEIKKVAPLFERIK